MQNRLREVQQMQTSYGMVLQAETYGECGATEGLPRMVLKKESPLYEEASTSKVVTILPKRMQLRIIRFDGDMTKVATPDGSEGWVVGKLLRQP